MPDVFTPDFLDEQLKGLTRHELAFINAEAAWIAKARRKQVLPLKLGLWTDETGKQRQSGRGLLMTGRGWGKALALDTPIPTPIGWTTNGALVDGDTIFDEDGRPCRVLKAHAVRLGRPCYRVEFSDGSTVVADAEHLWATIDRRERKNSKRRGAIPLWRVLNTEQIAASLYDHGDRNHAVPCAQALVLPTAILPFDPYLLGCWLGDGHSNGAQITTADVEIVNAFDAAGHTTKAYRSPNTGRATTYGIARWHKSLRLNGLLNNKHIPATYLRASAEQRLRLLQGLFDTDGYCDPSNGSAEYCSTKWALAKGVHELALSLGLKAVIYDGRATLKGRDCGPKYRVCFTAHRDFPLFRLLRKLKTQAPRGDQSDRAYRRYITAVVRVPSVPVRCITVDSPSSLYLAGEAMIPTHNTETAANWCRRCAGLMPGSMGHVVAPTHGDLVGTVFEGISGLLKAIPEAMIDNMTYSPYPLLTLTNKTTIRGFSAEKPDRLRGPQCNWLWGDETAAWQYYDDMMANIDFSTRLVYERKEMVFEDGKPVECVVERIQPQRLFSTTPRPIEQLRELAEDRRVHQVRGSLQENKANLAETFIEDVEKHEGTKLGDQEIHGLILAFDESAIIKKRWIRMWPKGRELPQFEFIYISFDTALTEESYDKKKNTPDYTACTVWGVFMFESRMNVMLLTSWRERLGMPELIERAKGEMKMEYGYVEPPKFKVYAGQGPSLMRAPRKPKLMIIEDKGSGTSLRQMLAKEQVPMYPYNPGKASKMARLNAVSHVVAGGKERKGRMWIPESVDSTKEKPLFASWSDQFIAEFCIYAGPGSTKNDDFVDSGSQALRYFADNYLPGQVEKKDPKKAPARAPVRVGNPYGG